MLNLGIPEVLVLLLIFGCLGTLLLVAVGVVIWLITKASRESGD